MTEDILKSFYGRESKQDNQPGPGNGINRGMEL
jgi:hypothetical protein